MLTLRNISELKNVPTITPNTQVCVQHPKVGDPPLFSGKKEEFEGFLAGLNVVFALQQSIFPDDKTKIYHAYSFLQGSPCSALTPAISNEAMWDTINWTRSYSAFCQYLCKNYCDPDERQTAINKILSLKQI